MLRTAIAAFACLPIAAHAQVYTGVASAIDGDTLRMTGTTIRLLGIDAPEAGQSCDRAGQVWTCGKEATALLAGLISEKTVTCEQRAIDAYARVVAVCSLGEMDLGRTMIDAGYALALPQFTDAYVQSEARMRALRVGIWGSAFDSPADYRAAHPQAKQADRQSATDKLPKPRRATTQTRQPTQVYFRNCAQAWSVGAAPFFRGQPGYRADMDGDNDGVACEPRR